jgi:hypothetical protein
MEALPSAVVSSSLQLSAEGTRSNQYPVSPFNQFRNASTYKTGRNQVMVDKGGNT